MISARLRASFVMADPDAPPKSSRKRVAVENRSDGGIVFWVGRLYLFAAMTIGARGA